MKFDVTSSDGAANGWNYEDGTLSPQKVQERIDAINEGGKMYAYKYVNGTALNDTSNYADYGSLTAQGPNPVWGESPTPGQWNGAQTTIQRCMLIRL